MSNSLFSDIFEAVNQSSEEYIQKKRVEDAVRKIVNEVREANPQTPEDPLAVLYAHYTKLSNQLLKARPYDRDKIESQMESVKKMIAEHHSMLRKP